jgi:hypothetical protein
MHISTSGLNGMGGQSHAPADLPREKPGTNLYGARWAAGPVWTGADNLAPTGTRSTDRPARGKSLYRLGYPDPHGKTGKGLKVKLILCLTEQHIVTAPEIGD